MKPQIRSLSEMDVKIKEGLTEDDLVLAVRAAIRIQRMFGERMFGGSCTALDVLREIWPRPIALGVAAVITGLAKDQEIMPRMEALAA